jgi:hypothetical protein
MKQFSFVTDWPDYSAPVQLAHFLADLPKGSKVEVTYKVVRETRSLAQSKRYWGLIVPVAAEILSAGRDIPLSKDQAHYVLKSAFIGVEETPLGTFPKDSRTLDVPQFKAFCDAVEEWMITKWGVTIPEYEDDL